MSKFQQITSSDVIAAYNTHGIEFLSADFENRRDYKSQTQYVNLMIKLANGQVCPLKNMALSSGGIQLGSGVKDPERRVYESLRFGVLLHNVIEDQKQEEPNVNVLALKYISQAYEHYMDELQKSGVIYTNKAKPGSKYKLISCDATTPFQETREVKDKATGASSIEYLDNPIVWVSIPKKKFYRPSDKRPDVRVLDGVFYNTPDGKQNLDAPMKSYEFNTVFYNALAKSFSRTTGKAIYNLLGEKIDGKVILDNLNAQNYLTRGSVLTGSLRMEIVIAGRGAKLDVTTGPSMCVISVPRTYEQGTMRNAEAVDDMVNEWAHLMGTANTGDEETKEEVKQEKVDQDDEDDFNDMEDSDNE
jgi:hypothetical protein